MIKVRQLIKKYADGEKDLYALNEIDLEISKGEFVVILGPSGSGKSTLMNIMSGLDDCDFGKVLIDELDITALTEAERTRFRRENIGFIFQSYYLMADLNVENNIKMGAFLVKNKDYDNVIDSLNLTHLLKRMPFQLSGGQQQRVAIARALSKKPKILFCDEPTGALDEEHGKQVLNLIQKYQIENHVTVVMVTHNPGIAQMANTVIKMNSGNIIDIIKNPSPISATQVKWG